MVKRQVMKSRLREQVKLMKKKKERYLAPLTKSKPLAPRKGPDDRKTVRVLTAGEENEATIVLSEYKDFMCIAVKPFYGADFETEVYLSPLPEFEYAEGLNIYTLVFDDCKIEGRPARAVAADVTFVKGFDILTKYYLLEREAFMEFEQPVFDGVAELATIDKYCFPGGKEGLDVQKIKKGFKSINDTYREEKAGIRRNLFVLEPEKPKKKPAPDSKDSESP